MRRSEREVSICRRHIVCQDGLVFPKFRLLVRLLPSVYRVPPGAIDWTPASEQSSHVARKPFVAR